MKSISNSPVDDATCSAYHPVEDYQSAVDCWDARLNGQTLLEYNWDSRQWEESFKDILFQDLETGYWKVKPNAHVEPPSEMDTK